MPGKYGSKKAPAPKRMKRAVKKKAVKKRKPMPRMY